MYYYVNKNAQHPGKEHEVHNENCDDLPDVLNRVFLGSHDNCNTAIEESKKYYDNVDGCYWCSRSCHTR